MIFWQILWHTVWHYNFSDLWKHFLWHKWYLVTFLVDSCCVRGVNIAWPGVPILLRYSTYTYFKEPWNTFRCALHTVAPAITRSHNCFKQPLGFMAKPQETWLTQLKQNDCPCAYRGMMLHMSCLFFGTDIDFTPIPTSVGGPTRGSSTLSRPDWGREAASCNLFGGFSSNYCTILHSRF